MDRERARIKKENLLFRLKGIGSLVVAYSGGVDSTFLLTAAHDTLGKGVIAATATSVIHPLRETEFSQKYTREKGIRHIVFRSKEMDVSGFVQNDHKRCYRCKQYLFRMFFTIARQEGIHHVAHGANMDDLSDYRPGFKAAEEAGAIAPLVDAQLNKEEVRFLSKEMGLSTWNHPSLACLASRVPYGSRITEEKLVMIAKAEDFLLEKGLRDIRVRHHGLVARIEVGEDELEALVRKKFRKAIIEKFRKIGFEYIALDLEGYMPGKMNRELKEIVSDSLK